MIASSRSAALAALVIAGILHTTLIMAMAGRTTPTAEVTGGNGGMQARLGNSFADMAAGTLSTTSAEEILETTPPLETTEKAQPDNAIPPDTPAQTAQADPPDHAETVKPSAIPVEQAHVDTARTAPTETEPTPTFEMSTALSHELTEPSRTTQAQAVSVTQPQPLQPEVTPNAAPLQAEQDTGSAVTRSRRPKTRSATFEERHTPKTFAARKTPKAQPTPKKTATTRSGNAAKNARAGSATGRESATSKTEGQQKTAAAQAGNAAISNYPGLVMRKLSRAGKPRVNARGAAVVAFTIGGSGRLASVSLARGSGTSALDRAALRLVERAGPFPSPPQGARRSFTIQIKGR